MFGEYTADAQNQVFDFAESELDAVWQDIQNTPQDTPADLWKKKLLKIGREFHFSSRFTLVRILCGRANHIAPSDYQMYTYDSFQDTVNGHFYQFQNISLDHIETLSPEEHLQYIAYLLALADQQSDSDPEVNADLISRAWHDERSANELADYLLAGRSDLNKQSTKSLRNEYQKEHKKTYRNRLTREEKLKLGHILDFTLEEMQWYLLRTSDTGDVFRYNQAADLIDAYGFQIGASWQRVLNLKNMYQKLCANTEKVQLPDRTVNYTRNASESLFGKIEMWRLRPETMDQEFLSWMQEKAPELDVPSQTAATIYRNLTAYAHNLITGVEAPPLEEELISCIQCLAEPTLTSEARQLLCENGVLSQTRCKAIAGDLLFENKSLTVTIQKDRTKAWHVLETDLTGDFSQSGGIINAGRTRLEDLLFNNAQVEKADMLYLLWFIANLVWISIPDNNMLCCRILDFMDIADIVLKKALLPAFYVPHPIEQSMLLSIVCGRSEDDTPSVVYEYILSSLKKKRNRMPGSTKHTEEEKIEIVKEYRADRETTLEKFAEKKNISPKTLSAWQKKLLAEGKL